MILDANTQVCSSQQVTADAASDDSITGADIAVHRKIGTGEPIGFLVNITAIGTNSGSAILQAVKATNTGLTGSRVVGGAVYLVTADIAAGNNFFVPFAPGSGDDEFVGLYFDITGTVDFTVDAWLIPQSFFQEATAYTSGYTVTS